METMELPMVAGTGLRPPSRYRRVLFVWLPVRPIFPVGIGYLVNWIHREHPEVTLEVLDLTRFPEPDQMGALTSK
ncbi:MAG: Radical SAM protein, partial [Leptospirillum sp. Group IV 'UBA BS']